MIDLSQLFDSYSRQARLYPALLTLLPALIMLIAWIPDLLTTGQTILAVLVACGVLYFLADFARTRGKRLEGALLNEWGGWPTTIWLRHADTHLSVDVKRRYHILLSSQLQIGPLLTAAEEAEDPRSADGRYDAAVSWLREQCRGSAFPLIDKENATYGFRRNLLGMKPIGATICLLTIIFPGLLFAFRKAEAVTTAPQFLRAAYGVLPAAMIGAILFAALVLIVWLIVVRHSWVRQAGDQYARALLAGCDSLSAK